MLLRRLAASEPVTVEDYNALVDTINSIWRALSVSGFESWQMPGRLLLAQREERRGWARSAPDDDGWVSDNASIDLCLACIWGIESRLTYPGYRWKYRARLVLGKRDPGYDDDLSDVYRLPYHKWVLSNELYPAYNLIELRDASGGDIISGYEPGYGYVHGNGVNTASLPIGLEIRPAPRGIIVFAAMFGNELWFQYENAVDGKC